MTTKTTGAVLDEPHGRFVLKQVELDDPRDDEILVVVEASGVCHTDVAVQDGLTPPMVLGHEGTGVVQAIGSGVRRVRPGERVIVSYPWCGDCNECLTGHAYRCEQMFRLAFGGGRFDGSKTITMDGRPVSSAFFQQSSFASHLITLERDVVPVGREHAAELLAAIPCGVQTGAGAILNSMQLGAGDSLAVFGTGAVGLSAIMAARLMEASTIIGVDIVESRLELALELGATHVINAANGEVPERIKELLPKGVRYSFETTGSEQGLDAAIESLCMGGECGFVTLPHRGAKYPFTLRGLSTKSATLRGIISGSALPNDFLPKLIEWQQQGRFPYDRLITTYDFEDINQAFADSAEGRAIKPVLMMHPGS